MLGFGKGMQWIQLHLGPLLPNPHVVKSPGTCLANGVGESEFWGAIPLSMVKQGFFTLDPAWIQQLSVPGD